MKRLAVLSILTLLLGSCTTTSHSNLNSNIYEYIQGMEKLIIGLKKNIPTANKLKIAVLPILDENGNRTLLGDNTANVLQTGLFDQRLYTLVERERVDSILNEYDFSLNGLVDTSTMKEIGKLLAVDTIVVGTIRDELEHYSFFIRIIDIETGKVISVSNIMINKDSNIDKQYNEVIEYSKRTYEGVYALTIIRAKFALKDENNIDWDAFSRADVFFIVYVDDEIQYTSKVFSDFPDIEINDSFDIVLKKNSIITIVFFDEDMTTNQLIEKFSFTPDDVKKYTREIESIINLKYVVEMQFSIKKQ